MLEDIKILDDLKLVIIVVVVEKFLYEVQCDVFGCVYVIGKCKNVVVCVWVKLGLGKVVVNGKDIVEYFVCLVLQMILCQLFEIVGVVG